MNSVGCVILAGGKSSRMGMDKALVEYNGETFISRLTRELSWFPERFIARGDQEPFDETIVSGWHVIPDITPDHGPLGGLHAALSVCETEALFVVTCDMPLIKSSLVKKLGECWEESKEKDTKEKDTKEKDAKEKDAKGMDAVIVVGPDGRIHPLFGIYRSSVLPILEEQLMAGKNRVMDFLQRLQVRFVTIEDESEALQLANINTMQELRQL